MLIVNPQLRIPLAEFRFTFARSSGPGGQNVNKVNTKATLHWRVGESQSLPEEVRRRFLASQRRRVTLAGELLITSQRFRDAGRNVADCLDRLREMLATAAVRPKLRKATRPTRGSAERRLRQKLARSRKMERRRLPGDT
jgi:ribosome-associated protein